MTVIEMIYQELRDFREETKERLESIENEVKRTNGRVTTLESQRHQGKPDPRAPWYSDIARRQWFPWLIVFLASYVGPKFTRELLATIIELFKH